MSRHTLYVVSDLHLGGPPVSERFPYGFQMCPPRARARLGRFIRRLTSVDPADEGTVELVINGDFLDFLAEPDERIELPECFVPLRTDPGEICALLERLIGHCDDELPPDAQVFAALAAFVRAGHRFTLLLGNHDVELSLPAVRRALLRRLGADLPARVEFLLDGEACVRGPVVIEHGNRYDGWNLLDHGGLRALRAALSRDEALDVTVDVQPGSRLVAEVMNPLKARYRFIDLLKPENEVVLPILAALEPAALAKIDALIPELVRATRRERAATGVRRDPSYIADEGPLDDDPQLLETLAILRELHATWGGENDRETSPISDDDTRLRPSWLSSARGLWHRVHAAGVDAIEETRAEFLLRSFRHFRGKIERAFDPLEETDRYLKAAHRLARGGRRRLVLFGHTHLAKSIPLHERAHYLNTGTWCETMRLDPRWYAAEGPRERARAEVREFLVKLRDNAVDTQLDTLCARVVLHDGDHGRVEADLCAVDDRGVPMPVEGTSCSLAPE